jgi:hypothetical protein
MKKRSRVIDAPVERQKLEMMLQIILDAHEHTVQLMNHVDAISDKIEKSDHKDHFYAEAGDVIVQSPRFLQDLRGCISALEVMILDTLRPHARESMPRLHRDRWKKLHNKKSHSHLPGDPFKSNQLPNNRTVAEKFYFNTLNDGGSSVQDESMRSPDESIYEQSSAYSLAKDQSRSHSDWRDWSELNVSYNPSTSIPKNIRR